MSERYYYKPKFQFVGQELLMDGEFVAIVPAHSSGRYALEHFLANWDNPLTGNAMRDSLDQEPTRE